MEQYYNLIIRTVSNAPFSIKWAVVASIASAFIVLILVIMALGLLRKLYHKRQQKHDVKKQEAQAAKKVRGLFKIIIDFIISFFRKVGLDKRSPIASSFFNANLFLENNIGGRSYPYKLPRYALLGCENSGKSSLVESIDSRFMGSLPSTPPEEPNYLKWNFFDTGSLFEIPGEYLIQESAIDSNQEAWDETLHNMVQYRVQKPLDGIILTIPADELSTLHKLDKDSLLRRAEYVRKQLDALHTKVGFSLPVYVVITKCDLLEGFRAFTSVLPEEKLSNMFGWSSSFSLGETFSKEWVSYALDTIIQKTLDNQYECFLKAISSEQTQGIMLLPDSLDQLREPLKDYLQQIFKRHNYQRNFIFRGLYCTGKCERILSTLDGAGETAVPSNTVAFFHDLLFEKIFEEYRIALPDQNRIFSISRSVNIARGSLLAIFIIWSAGMWHDFSYLRKRIASLHIHLRQAAALIKNQQPPQKVVFMDGSLPNVAEGSLVYGVRTLKQASNLLADIDKRSFSMIFMPSSWTNSIDTPFTHTVGIILNRLIFQPVYYGFVHKLHVLTSPPIDNLSEYTNESALFSPLTTPEFLLLRGYAETISYYDKALTTYHGLRETHNVNDLSILSLFLFNFKLPSEFSDNKSFYSQAIKYGHPKSEVPVNDFVSAAKFKLYALSTQFFDALFKKGPSFELLSKTAKDVNIIGGNLVSVKDIHNVYLSMEYTRRNIDLPSFNWISLDKFNPGPAYSHVLNIVDDVNLFGNDSHLSSRINETGNVSLPTLQQQLANYRSDTTGPLLAIAAQTLEAQPSSGYINLLENLRLFLNQGFMNSVNQPQDFSSQVPAGKFMMWDAGELKSIVDWVLTYENFVNNDLKKYPSTVQEHIKLIAQKHLSTHIKSSVAMSQTFIDAPSSLSAFALEDAVRTQVSNLKKALPVFEKILQTLEQYGMTTAYLELRNLLVGQCYILLQTIDSFFNTEAFYEPLNGNFSWWTGNKNIGMQAYNVQSAFGLRSYLNNQHDRIIYLSTQYAEPLVTFLTQPFLHLEPSKVNLLSKWRLIIEQVNAFQTHKPANSIHALEHFLEDEANQLDASNCLKKLHDEASKQDYTGNWFVQKELVLKKNIYAQCQHLFHKDATDGYEKLQMFFNSHLANKYPFVGGNLTSIKGEASPEAIRSFFAMYDDYKTSINIFLKEKPATPHGQQLLQFMGHMDKVQSFFNSFLKSPNPTAVPTYKLNVKFRTNKRFEQGASQVLTWLINIGGTDLTNHTSDNDITWQYGQPMSVSFQWINNGPFSPAADPNQPHLLITGNTAMYTTDSPWSLLKFVDMHRASAQFLSPYRDKATQYMMFTVPTQSNFEAGNPQTMMARLFIDVLVELVDQHGTSTPIEIPYFPNIAPNLK